MDKALTYRIVAYGELPVDRFFRLSGVHVAVDHTPEYGTVTVVKMRQGEQDVFCDAVRTVNESGSRVLEVESVDRAQSGRAESRPLKTN